MRIPFKGKRARNRIRPREEGAARPRLPWRLVGKALALGGTLLATFLVVFWALDQPIRTVRLTGRFQHLTPQQIEQVVAAQVRGKGLLTVNLGAVSRAIQALPWVDAVSVARQWPHGLTVSVLEQVAAARWGHDGLVNANGVLFVTGVSHFPPGLARLSGPEGSQGEVTRRYLAMRRSLRAVGLGLAAVRLDARGAWRLRLSDGIAVRLGRAQVQERFDKFTTAALGIVEQRAADISYVDMRYTNGFAIGWKSGQGPARNARAALGPLPAKAEAAPQNRLDAMDGHWRRANESQHA
jgi:cell division protein FtsQ